MGGEGGPARRTLEAWLGVLLEQGVERLELRRHLRPIDRIGDVLVGQPVDDERDEHVEDDENAEVVEAAGGRVARGRMSGIVTIVQMLRRGTVGM